ncbi:flagellar biosynthesis anti-sigma factor FlgM [Pseudoduganella namucuonensis]|uniref:Negative regulator of flagellin synthesis n=1 Tax=Pseudoduganella namucuonensis TaxID=1035707 RepID=A0A1I7HU83_9BURK|nr:flagellar biosynthesis anti-sigma factor FlgM [Pseudoduganella namucuonensis]SFU64217.1 anti-sigma-28 factor, FlgM family [Pseudoduganella namucuonensis]
MRISSGIADGMAVQRVAEPVAGAAPAPAAPAAAQSAGLQSAVLQPALAAMKDMPEIDHDKVAQLRDALAKGELPFDANKLAGLIQRFHGSDQ